MTVNLNPKGLLKLLLAIISFLVLMNLGGIYSTYWLGHGNLKGMVEFFHLNRENNLPSLYSSFAIMLCAFLLYVVSLSKKKLKNFNG